MKDSLSICVLPILFCLCLVGCKNKEKPNNDLGIKQYEDYINTAKQYERSNIDSALHYAKKAHAISKKNNDPIEEIRSLNTIGWNLRFLGNLKESYNKHSEALELSRKIKDTKYIARTFNYLGAFFTEQSDYQTALEYYLQSYELRLKLNDTLGQATVAGNIGLNNYYLGQYDVAEKYMSISSEINTAYKDTLYMAGDYEMISMVYNSTNRVDKAYEANKKALDLYQRTGDRDGEIMAMGNLGSLYRKQKEFEKAKDYFVRSMKLCREMNIPSRLLLCHKRFMELYHDIGEYKLSLLHADSATTVNNKLNHKNYQQQIYKNQAESYQALQQHEKAIEMLKKSMVIQDSINSEKKTNRLAVAEVKLNVIEKEAAIVKLENDQLLAERLQNRLLLGHIGLGATAGFIVFRIRFISLMRKRRHAEEKEQLQRSFAQDIIRSIENERKRISRELHDGIGQSLLLIKNKVKLGSTSKDTTIIDNTIEEVRDMSLALHPYQFEQYGLVTSLRNLLDEFQENSKTVYIHDIDSESYDIDSTKEIFIYRMIQESLNNVEKHAQAEVCALRVTDNTQNILFQIKDNGVGFDLTTGSSKLESLGMKTLKERAALIQAKLVIESIVNKGTTIQIIIDK
ncbi:histidine kinase [Aquimarina sp. MAR_2010_214]|uniref:ATP-binding protein n=1 Tax=Aquimarina sp. MAR_2010_214 TaxID=1250026 RepID=UPI000C6FED2C|nr:tetratricopeptide repeat protein [Aquimarina sp. MAR_2010_214]PKV49960.1 histidine kinase [Aquimarina sp. MAR_2010_214]